MEIRSEFIVCYDVHQNRARRKLMEGLKDLGMKHLQESVFWGHLNAAERRAVLGLFRKHLDPANDLAFLAPARMKENSEKHYFGHHLSDFEAWPEVESV